MHVVTVHGFLNTGRQFGRLRRSLEARGHTCITPTLHPRDGRTGVADLAEKLAALIDAGVPSGAPLALVGFSMGAIVARYYLQVRENPRAVRALFSIAGPFRGSLNAYLYPGLGTRQMRPGSRLLGEIERTAGRLGMPVFTYRTPVDLMVIPSSGSRIPGAEDTVVWCPLHSLLPRDPQLVEHISRELDRLEPRPAPRPEPDWEPAV